MALRARCAVWRAQIGTGAKRLVSGAGEYRDPHVAVVAQSGEDVVDFLFKYVDAPRSVLHCLEEIHTRLLRLRGNESPLQTLKQTRDMVREADIINMMEQGGLHSFIDELQLGLRHIHEQVEQAWFRY